MSMDISLVVNVKLSGEDYNTICRYMLYKGILGQESDYNSIIGKFFVDNISEYVDGIVETIKKEAENIGK